MKAMNITKFRFATKSGKRTYGFSKGFGIYVEGKGFLAMGDDNMPYVLATKKLVQSTIDAGWWEGENAVSHHFIPAV